MNQLNQALQALLTALKDYNRALVETTGEGNRLVNMLQAELQGQSSAGFRAGEDPDDDEAETNEIHAGAVGAGNRSSH